MFFPEVALAGNVGFHLYVHNIIINRFLIFLKKKNWNEKDHHYFCSNQTWFGYDRFIDSKNKKNDDTFPAGLWITSF